MINRDKYREILFSEKCSGAIVTDLVNIRYLTGFTGSNAVLFIAAENSSDDLIVTDGRYKDKVLLETNDILVEISNDLLATIAAYLLEKQYDLIGFEAHKLRVAEFNYLKKLTKTLKLIDVSGKLEKLRAVKTETEIVELRKAGAIATRALHALVKSNFIQVGKTETEIARKLEEFMYDFGAEAIAFTTIVATGVNSAIPHHTPNNTKIAVGDFLKIDFGARINGYHSDITRTFIVGEPTSWQLEVYAVVKAAQQYSLDHALAGAKLSELDRRARAVIDTANWSENFSHSLGHGVGLEVHEAPTVNSRSKVILETGHIITIEPGVYFPKKGGVRIEDTVLITDTSNEILTMYPKELQIL